MLAERMDATGGAGMVRMAEPSLRRAVQRPEANKAYSTRGVRKAAAKDEEEKQVQKGIAEEKEAELRRAKRSMLSESMLKSTLSSMEERVNIFFHHLEYSLHEDSGQYFVKVVDNKTEEVIREIPPEKLLDIYASLMEMVGIFVDERR